MSASPAKRLASGGTGASAGALADRDVSPWRSLLMILSSVASLLEAIGSARPGDVVPVEFVRNSKQMMEQVRITPFLSEYLRGSVNRVSVRTDDVDTRMEYIKAEIERLRANLKELENQR